MHITFAHMIRRSRRGAARYDGASKPQRKKVKSKGAVAKEAALRGRIDGMNGKIKKESEEPKSKEAKEQKESEERREDEEGTREKTGGGRYNWPARDDDPSCMARHIGMAPGPRAP